MVVWAYSRSFKKKKNLFRVLIVRLYLEMIKDAIRLPLFKVVKFGVLALMLLIL